MISSSLYRAGQGSVTGRVRFSPARRYAFCPPFTAGQRTVDVPGRYGVQLFSASNREQFMVYLDEIGGDQADRRTKPGDYFPRITSTGP